jgi:membrane protease subunit HflC
VTRLRRTLIAVGAALFGFALWSSFVVVDVTEWGVVTRFGHVARVIREPGLSLKWPDPFETVLRLDRRLLTFKPASTEYLSEDKKNLVIHSLVTWRIADPERFLATVNARVTAQERIADVVLTKIGSVLGSHPAAALVAVEGHASRFARVMERIVAESRDQALADYGIDLVDIRLRQLTLPEQNRANVFGRMQAERGKMATTFRSEGEREFKKVVARAEREKTRIMAESYREAERAKGEGDAGAMRVYAEAFARNPQFYKFRRTLQAYERIIDGNTTLFLPADADIFQILNSERKPKAGK